MTNFNKRASGFKFVWFLFVFVAACLNSGSARAQFLSGDILVDEFESGAIEQYRPNGTLVRTFSGGGQIFEGASLTPDGNLVTTFRSPSPGVAIFNPSGQLIRTFLTPETSFPGDVSVFASGTLAVNSQLPGDILYYGQNGMLLKDVNPTNPKPFQPFGNAVAPDNTLWVTDPKGGNSPLGHVFHLDKDGNILSTFSVSFSLGDLVVAPDGTLFMTDNVGNIVNHFTPGGTLIDFFPVASSVTSGIALAPDANSLYVTGILSVDVYRYSLSGTLLNQIPLTHPGDPLFLTVVNVSAGNVPEPNSIAFLAALGATGFLFRNRARRLASRPSA